MAVQPLPLEMFFCLQKQCLAGADCTGSSDMWRLLCAYIKHSMLVYFLCTWLFCKAFTIQLLIFFTIIFEQLHWYEIPEAWSFATLSLMKDTSGKPSMLQGGSCQHHWQCQSSHLLQVTILPCCSSQVSTALLILSVLWEGLGVFWSVWFQGTREMC